MNQKIEIDLSSLRTSLVTIGEMFYTYKNAIQELYNKILLDQANWNDGMSKNFFLDISNSNNQNNNMNLNIQKLFDSFELIVTNCASLGASSYIIANLSAINSIRTNINTFKIKVNDFYSKLNSYDFSFCKSNEKQYKTNILQELRKIENCLNQLDSEINLFSSKASSALSEISNHISSIKIDEVVEINLNKYII